MSTSITPEIASDPCLNALYKGDAQRLSDLLAQHPGIMEQLLHNPYTYVADCIEGRYYGQDTAIELLNVIDSKATPRQRKAGLQSLAAKDRGYDSVQISLWALDRLDNIPSKLEKTVLFHAWKAPDTFEFHQIGAWRNPQNIKHPQIAINALFTLGMGGADPQMLDIHAQYLGEALNPLRMKEACRAAMMMLYLDRAMGRGFDHHRIKTDSLIWLDKNTEGGLRNAIEALSNEFWPEKKVISPYIEHMDLSQNTPRTEHKRPGQRL